MSDRLTRKDIKKQDQFVTTVEDSLDFATRYRRELLFGAGALVVLALAVVGWRTWAASRAADAGVALSEAMETFEAPLATDEAATLPEGATTYPDEDARREAANEDFRRVREDYSGSPAAGVAAVYLARIAAEDGRIEDAEALWREIAEGGADDPLAVQARLNLINLERSRDNHEQVVADLEAMLGEAEADLPDDTVLYELGLTLEDLDRAEEAETYYQRLADDYPDSAYAGRASQRLASLGSQPGGPGAF